MKGILRVNSPLLTPYIFLWGGVPTWHLGGSGSGPSKVKTLELPYDEEIRLAVTGWSGTRWESPSDLSEKNMSKEIP